VDVVTACFLDLATQNLLAQEEEYLVERIVSHRYNNEGDIEFLVKWKGYSNEENSWLPQDAISFDVLQQYNLFDYTNITQIIQTLGGDVKRVGGDGNCLFYACAVLLSRMEGGQRRMPQKKMREKLKEIQTMPQYKELMAQALGGVEDVEEWLTTKEKNKKKDVMGESVDLMAFAIMSQKDLVVLRGDSDTQQLIQQCFPAKSDFMTLEEDVCMELDFEHNNYVVLYEIGGTPHYDVVIPLEEDKSNSDSSNNNNHNNNNNNAGTLSKNKNEDSKDTSRKRKIDGTSSRKLKK